MVAWNELEKQLTGWLPPLTGSGQNSWPIMGYNGLLISKNQSTNCAKATALVDWIYWTQSSSTAATIASRNGITVAGKAAGILKQSLTQLTSVTCQGVLVSSIAGCVNNGELCSNHGTCQSQECLCSIGWTGVFCDGTPPPPLSPRCFQCIT
jgi:hypothetical protein